MAGWFWIPFSECFICFVALLNCCIVRPQSDPDHSSPGTVAKMLLRYKVRSSTEQKIVALGVTLDRFVIEFGCSKAPYNHLGYF